MFTEHKQNFQCFRLNSFRFIIYAALIHYFDKVHEDVYMDCIYIASSFSVRAAANILYLLTKDYLPNVAIQNVWIQRKEKAHILIV